jgi:NADH-quinone oxidoreductase subunit G
MGFGRDISRFAERKRVVKDKDIGPLVSTDMTRCIHCTRCVRFGDEVTGLQQLGTTERGEHMKIGTYVEQSIDHELSANIIDLCPVGALNNKPYRYSARAWEMTQIPTVSPHDCVGSNMYAHVLRGTVKRIVPRENEAINETWIADRDRFSYEGVYAGDRLQRPRLKSGDAWEDVSWEDALNRVANALKAADTTGILASPGSTIEEFHLLAKLADHLGTSDIDHRIRQRDYSDQGNDPLMPYLGCSIADLEKAGAILVAGSNLRKEAPIIGHRVRKAALAGSKISMVNVEPFDVYFDLHEDVHGPGLVQQLAGIAVAAAGSKSLPVSVAGICKGVDATAEQKRIAASLAEADNAVVITGLIAARHKAASAIRALGAAIGELTGASFGTLSESANSAGGHIAGALPHRSAGGTVRDTAGMNAAQIVDGSPDVTLLFGLEPGDLTCSENALTNLEAQKFVVAFTPYASESLMESANLLLPTGTFAETSGTFVNCEGRWQSFAGIANPIAEARPGWKVLRVIGNLLDAEGFEYTSSEEILDELKARVGETQPDNSYHGSSAIAKPNGADEPGSEVDVPIYDVDAVVRRSAALQLTPEAKRARGETA